MGGIEKRPDGSHNMTKVFERRVVTTDGAQGDYILNHRAMALLDFYVCTAIFPVYLRLLIIGGSMNSGSPG